MGMLVASGTLSLVGAVIAVIVFGVAYFFFNLWWIRRVQRHAFSALREGNIDAYLTGIARLRKLRYFSRTPRVQVDMNYAVGLYLQGRFGEALEILERLDSERIPEKVRFAVAVNGFSNLSAMNRLGDARLLFDSKIGDVDRWLSDPVTGHGAVATKAAYEFHFGDQTKAKELFQTALSSTDVIPNQAIVHMRLGQIALRQNNAAEARTHFAEARRLGQGTFVPEAITALTRTNPHLTSE